MIHTSTGGSLAGGVLNLVNSIVGAGVLSLPYAFKLCGRGVGVAYVLIFGALARHSSSLLIESSAIKGIRSYEGLASAAMGRAGWYWLNLAIFANNTGACLSYMIVIGDIVPNLLTEMGMPTDRSVVLALATVLIIFPLAAQRDISALEHASGLAILIYFAFATAMFTLFLGSDAEHLDPPPALVKSDPSGYIRAAPLTVFSYTCMPAIFPIYQELSDPTPARMAKLTTLGIGFACVVYVITGYGGYSFFGEDTRGDVLLNLATLEGAAFKWLRLAIGVSICLTYPMLMYPARRSLDQMLFNSSEGNAPYARLFVETVAIVGASLCVGIYVESLEAVMGFIGSVASTCTLLILPATIYLCISPAGLAANWHEVAFLVTGVSLGVLGLVVHIQETFQ